MGPLMTAFRGGLGDRLPGGFQVMGLTPHCLGPERAAAARLPPFIAAAMLPQMVNWESTTCEAEWQQQQPATCCSSMLWTRHLGWGPAPGQGVAIGGGGVGSKVVAGSGKGVQDSGVP